MKKKLSFKKSLGVLSLLLMQMNSASFGAEDASKQQGQGSAPLSENIQGEVKEKLNIQKTPPNIELSVKDIIESGTPQTDHVLQEAKPIPSDQDYEHFASLNSKQVMKPWNSLIPEPPLVTFYTGLSNVATKRWEFRVSNQGGELVKVIQGKGVPPRSIEWNGLNERGQFINVGTLYSYQFVTFDEHDNAYTFPGEPFQLDALMYKEKGKLYIEIANTKLFTDGQATIRAPMKDLWDRAVDIVRENSNKPLTIEMYADSVKNPLAEERRQMAVTSISDATNIPATDIRHKVDKIADRGDVIRFVFSVR